MINSNVKIRRPPCNDFKLMSYFPQFKKSRSWLWQVSFTACNTSCAPLIQHKSYQWNSSRSSLTTDNLSQGPGQSGVNIQLYRNRTNSFPFEMPSCDIYATVAGFLLVLLSRVEVFGPTALWLLQRTSPWMCIMYCNSVHMLWYVT